MLKIITKIELQSTIDLEPEFRRVPLVHPFGNLKATTSPEDAGELTTINITATVEQDADFLHEPSIVRISWFGGSATVGTKSHPVMFSVTDDEKVEISTKYLSATRL